MRRHTFDTAHHDHDGGPVLIVVEDGDVQATLQLRFDLEAGGSGDIFQVYRPETRSDGGHGFKISASGEWVSKQMG